MTEQQKDLKNVIEKQNSLIEEIQKINNQLNIKRETVLKLQGIIEYLTASGVTPSEESFDEKNNIETIIDPFKK